MPFVALGALFDDLLQEAGDDVPPPQRRALKVAMLRLEPDGAAVDPRALANGVLHLLRRADFERPVLIALDDVHWIDDASRGVLESVMNRRRALRLQVLAAQRADYAEIDFDVERDQQLRLELGPLSAGAIRELVLGHLSVSLDKPALRTVMEISAGNPLFALELVRGHDVRELAGGYLRLKSSVGDLVRARLDVLPRECRYALGAVAAMRDPSLSRIVEVIELTVLDDAFAAGVLELDQTEVRFSHPLLASVVYESMPPGARRDMHALLARHSESAEERGLHLAAAVVVPDEETAQELERGAESAQSRGARSVAAHLAEEAARLTPGRGSPPWGRRLLRAAENAYASGDPARGRQLCTTLVDTLPRGDQRADALTMMSFHGLSVTEDVALCERALAESETPAGRARSLIFLSSAIQTRDLRAAVAHAQEAQQLAASTGDLALQAETGRVAGCYEAFLDPMGGGLRTLREAARLAKRAREPVTNLYHTPETGLGLVLFLRDEFPEARELLERQLTLANEVGDEDSASNIMHHLVQLEVEQGNLAAARTIADAALAIEDNGASGGEVARSLLGRALVAAHDGDLGLTRSMSERALQITREIAHQTYPILLSWVLGFLELSLGQPARALELLDDLPEQLERIGWREPGMMPFVPDRLEAMIGVGDDRATAEAHDWLELGLTLDRPRLLATAERAEGMIAAGRRDFDAAFEHFDAALRHHERLAVPHQQARTRLAYGSALRRAGRRRDARSHLTAALETFTRLGEPLWVTQAGSQIARLGGRAPATATLTPAERSIAALAAQGQSNSDIAVRLSISIRTVEATLSRVYSKLQLRSRAALAAQWDTIEPSSKPS
jgi:DNA-binding CsgD family transcriptional regulator